MDIMTCSQPKLKIGLWLRDPKSAGGICLSTCCEHGMALGVQQAYTIGQLGHKQKPCGCKWLGDRYGSQDNYGIVAYCIQYGVGPSVLYTGSRGNSHLSTRLLTLCWSIFRTVQHLSIALEKKLMRSLGNKPFTIMFVGLFGRKL